MNQTQTQPQAEPHYPLCKCQSCGTIFYDHLDLYPGPALCPTCNERDKAKAQKTRRARRW